MKYLIFIIALSILVVYSAHANGFGQTLDKAVGDYIVNVDYDSPILEIDTQSSVRFNFQLWSKDRTEPVEFDNVWVKISPQNSSIYLFAGTLSEMDFGPAGFSYFFPQAGVYDIMVRFDKDHKSLHDDAIFSVTVVGGEDGIFAQGGSGRSAIFAGIAGIIIGLVVGFMFKKKTA